MIHGGVKTNVIPDEVYVEVDIRTLPGETSADVQAHLRAALGDLYDDLEVEPLQQDPHLRRAIDTPMWDTLGRIINDAHPGSTTATGLIVGATDSRFFRDRGAVAYGAGLFSPKVRWRVSRSDSTATTNASTSSHWASARNFGST